ncbi:MAG: hypothetical protein SGBAC_003112 [Bacillariaceae sp.]
MQTSIQTVKVKNDKHTQVADTIMGMPLLLAGSSDSRSVVESIQAAIDNPRCYDRLIVSGIDLECEIASSLQILFKHRSHPWAEIVILKSIGPIHGLLTLILEHSKAPVNLLTLDNTIGERGVSSAIRRGLSKNRDACKLKEIALTNSCLSAWIMEDLVTGICAHSGVRKLLCVGCEFLPRAAEILSRGLRNAPHVQEMNLYGSQIDDYDLASIVGSCSNLTSIDIGKTICGPKTIDRLGVLLDDSSRGKPAKCKLTSLEMNYYRHLGTVAPLRIDLTPLFQGLAQNSTLKRLTIASLSVDDRSAECLVTCLQKNDTLETMVLTDCGLSQVAMTLILENLANFKGMRRLHLDGRQKLGLYGKQQIAEVATEALRTKNTLLEALPLPPGFDFYRYELDQLLDRNLAGRRMLFRTRRQDDDKMAAAQMHTEVLSNPSAVWPYVLERVNKVTLPNGSQMNPQSTESRRADMIYYMLQQRILLEN